LIALYTDSLARTFTLEEKTNAMKYKIISVILALSTLSCSSKDSENCNSSYNAETQSGGDISSYIYTPKNSSLFCYEKALKKIEDLETLANPIPTPIELEERNEYYKQASACGIIVEPPPYFEFYLKDIPNELTSGVENLSPTETVELIKIACIEALYFPNLSNVSSLDSYDFKDGNLFVEYQLDDGYKISSQKKIIEYIKTSDEDCDTFTISCEQNYKD